MVNKFNHDIPKEQGIYMLWSKSIPDMLYIGSAKNMKRRCYEHYRHLSNKKHYNYRLQNHVNKHGLEDLNICIHVIDNTLSDIELRNLEAHEIKFFNTYKKGFNLTDVTTHPVLSEEARKIISIKAKIRQSDPKIKEILKINNSGSKNPNSKLTNNDIQFIRENKDLSKLELSKLFKVNRRTIDRVITKVTYK